MNYYIWLDQNQNEIKRQEKTRGRPRSDATQHADGNWYIGGTPKSVTPKEQSPVQKVEVVHSVPEAEEIEVNVFSEVGREAKIFKNASPVEVPELLKGIFFNPKDQSSTNGEIDLRKVIIQRDFGITGIPFGAVYSRFLIKQDGSIYIWSSNRGDVTYIVHNAAKLAD